MDEQTKYILNRAINSSLFFYVFEVSGDEPFRMVRDSHHKYRTSLGEVKTTKEWEAELYPANMKTIYSRNGSYEVVRMNAKPRHYGW